MRKKLVKEVKRLREELDLARARGDAAEAAHGEAAAREQRATLDGVAAAAAAEAAADGRQGELRDALAELQRAMKAQEATLVSEGVRRVRDRDAVIERQAGELEELKARRIPAESSGSD